MWAGVQIHLYKHTQAIQMYSWHACSRRVRVRVCVCVCRFSYDLLTCVSRGSARDEPKNNYSNNNHPKCKFTDHAAAAGDGLAGRHAELPDCLRCGHTHSHTGCLLFHLFSFIFCQPKGGGIVLSMFYVFNP